MDSIERYRGSLLGLAVADAVGTTVEFSRPGSFPLVTDMVGGGPFNLAPGQWTDDTSMALCLAESLTEKLDFDPVDQLTRYVRWFREGHRSSTGRCFDIGGATRAALVRFEDTGDPYPEDADTNAAGNGSLMRLAPVPLFYAHDLQEVAVLSGLSSRTTHGAQVATDACRYYGVLIASAVRGMSKADLLGGLVEPEAGHWRENPLHPEVKAVALGSYKDLEPPEIQGRGYVVKAMEAALWAFHKSDNFRDGCLLAVNLGDDADTTAAIYGQLAGAHYGAAGIPDAWRARLYEREEIEKLADKLFMGSSAGGTRLSAGPDVPGSV